MRGVNRSVEQGICSLSNEEENEIHILLKCKATQRWTENLLNDEWQYINKQHARKQLVVVNYRIETFRQSSVKIKVHVRKPTAKKLQGSE